MTTSLSTESVAEGRTSILPLQVLVPSLSVDSKQIDKSIQAFSDAINQMQYLDIGQQQQNNSEIPRGCNNR